MRLYICVIPIPLSRKRMGFSGYNQSKIISRAFCQASGNKIFKLKSNIVIKNKETSPQTKTIDRRKRIKNVYGVFQIKNPGIIKDKVFVIDDFTKTDSPLREIIKILRKAKAKKVIGITLAH